MLICVGFYCICVGFYVIWSIFVGNECCLVWVGTGYPLTYATLYTHFSELKKSPARINDKRFSPLKRRSESAAFSPHVKLSSVKISITSEIFYLRSQMLRTARWGWYLSKCFGWHGSTLIPRHAAVCANFVLGSNVQLLRVITQSTGLAFLPSLPIVKKLGSNSTFMFSKKLCAKFYTTHRVIFFITLYFLISIACSRTCSDLSQPPAFWWLTV